MRWKAMKLWNFEKEEEKMKEKEKKAKDKRNQTPDPRSARAVFSICISDLETKVKRRGKAQE